MAAHTSSVLAIGSVVPEFVGKLVSQSESKQNTVVVWSIVGFLALAVSTPVPTLSEWAQVGLAMVLAAVAVWGLRRRRTLGTV